MSNQQWTPKPTGRDPRQPFGSPKLPTSQAPTSIETFSVPRKPIGRNILIAAVAIAVCGGAMYGLQTMGSNPEPTMVPSSQPTAATSSLGATSNSVPFEQFGGGTFEVVSTTWGADALRVRVRVTLNKGFEVFAVQIFDNETMYAYEPYNSPSLSVSSDEPVEATFEFPTLEGEGTVVLTDSRDQAIAALPVKR